ncbi:hypothetical protein PanWU01x14_313440, partial [Parasponia andersonii]
SLSNSPRIPLADIVRFATWTKPPSAAHSFQNASDRERYPHPYKECFVPLSSRCGISQSPPLKGSASPLTIDSGTGSDTISNSPRIPLANIVRFATWTKPPSAAHGFQNASDKERYPHPYKECFIPLSSRCGISQFKFRHRLNDIGLPSIG